MIVKAYEMWKQNMSVEQYEIYIDILYRLLFLEIKEEFRLILLASFGYWKNNSKDTA